MSGNSYVKKSGVILPAQAEVIVPMNPHASQHQASYTNNGGTEGALTLFVQPRGTVRYELLTVGGEPYTIPMNADFTTPVFFGQYTSMKFVQDGFDGDDYQVCMAGS